MTWVSKITSNVMGNRVELSPPRDIDATPEQIGAAFDIVFAELGKIGLFPTRLEVATAADEDTEADPQNITQARHAERIKIANEIMTWAERNHEQERYGPASALAIASNMIRRGSST